MATINIPENEFLRLGLEHVGFGADRQRGAALKLRRFRAAYGVGPAALSAVFDDLQTMDNDKFRIEYPDPFFFLIAVHWLKTYMVEEIVAGWFDLTEKTARKQIWKYVCSTQALKGQKILWPDFEAFDRMFILSVDGVHCRISEQRRNPDRRWVSYKLKKPALAYEIGLALHEDKCVWVRGPFKGGTKDPAMFMGEAVPIDEEGDEEEDEEDVDDEEEEEEEDLFMLHPVEDDDDDDDDDESYAFEEQDDIEQPVSLFNMIPDGKLVYGDKGYVGVPRHVLSGHNICDTDEVKEFKRRVGARHESFNKRLKAFKALDERFRHNVAKHKVVFEAILVLVQYDLEHGHPLFKL